MEKQFVLAANFAKAPKELQDAVKAYSDIWKKLEKAKNNLALLQKEIHDLEIQEGESAKVVRKLLSTWDASL